MVLIPPNHNICNSIRLIAKDPDLRDHSDPRIQALVETNFFGLNRALLTLLLAGGLVKPLMSTIMILSIDMAH